MIDKRVLNVVYTARYGSFTAAAHRVGVTQSAITKSVADLEQQLGYSIFNRTARGVLLTEEGRTFVERAAHLLDDAQDLLHGGPARSDPYAGVLRVGVCPASLEWLLMEPLSALMAKHPSIRLNIAGGNFDKIVQQLRAGAIDVVLGYETAFIDQPDLRYESLPPMLTAFFVRLGHPLLAYDKVTAEDIAKYNLILPSGAALHDFFRRQFHGEASVGSHDWLHIIDYFPIVARLVHNTNAIGAVSIHYTHTRIFKSRFACLPFPDSVRALPPSPICCATRLRWAPSPAVGAFIKACREQLPSAELAKDT